jgi:hypothetical protein
VSAPKVAGTITLSAEAMVNIAEENERLRAAVDSLEKQLKLAQSARDAWKGTAELRAKKLLEVHDLYLERITALEEHNNRSSNYVQGLPTREEYERMRESVSGLLARENV